MEALIAFLAAISVFSLCLRLIPCLHRRASALSLLGMEESERAEQRPVVRPLPLLRRAVTRLGDLLPEAPAPEAASLLQESGTDWTPSFLRGVRLASALAFALLPLPLGPSSLLLSPLLAAAAYHAPVVMLKQRAKRRGEEVAADLPEIVDLMAVLCFAGESLHTALHHSLQACAHHATRAVMEGVVERMRLGESASEALRRASAHSGREMRRFCRTLLRADETGAPIADILEELAVEFRNGRRERERTRAARVSIYILFPLVFMILPSFLLLTVGGIILGNTM